MKIAHLSDIHISTLFKKNNIGKTKKLIKSALSKGFDHLVITGDISENSEEIDFIIMSKILKSFELLDSNKTSIVIGNHDVFGGVQTPFDIVNFPSRCINTIYDKKVSEFVNHFKELFDNCYFPVKNKFFPYAKVINNFVFVGLNTVDHYSRIKNPFASNGKVNKEQFDGIKTIFGKSEYKSKHKIILAHHHFYKNSEVATSSSLLWNRIESFTLKLREKKKLINLFAENNVELVLHGHSHEIREYNRKGIKFINAGGSLYNSFSEASSILLIDTQKNYETKVDRLENNLIYGNSLLSTEMLAPSRVA